MDTITLVININTLPSAAVPDDSKHVYIGRQGGGAFGSPIIRGKRCPQCGSTHYGRGATLDCYRLWLRRRIVSNADFREQVKALHGHVLVCHCAPEPCHGLILAEVADWLVHEEQVAKKMAQVNRILNAEDKEADAEEDEDSKPEENDDGDEERDGEDGLSVFHSERKAARANRKAKVQARRVDRRALKKPADAGDHGAT